MLGKLIKLLGEENTKKIEDGITDIILDRIKDDLETWDTYILEPDEITKFVEKCKEKAFAKIESELIKKLESDMRKSLSLLNKK